MIGTLVRRVKAIMIMGVAIAVVGGAWYVVEGYGDQDERRYGNLGPRNPGLDERTGCRFMTIEVEGSDSDGRPGGTGRLNADLGTAGKITNQQIKILNPAAPDDPDVWAFRQEFCAMPGSKLSAVVTMDREWEELECFFRSGPMLHADDNTTRHGRISKTIMTTCAGVVP